MTDLEKLRAFAQSMIDDSHHVEDEVGQAGAHEEITVRGICERVIALIDASPPLTSPDRIPPLTQQSLDLYAKHGVPPGHFLRAVLEGDLFAAFRRADPADLAALPAIVTYVYERLPSASSGSPEVVSRWIARPRS